MTICDYLTFPYEWLKNTPKQSRNKGNQGTRQQFYYKDLITAFDIETTRIREIEQSVMYIWQWSFNNEYLVIGRTWYEFKMLVKGICNALAKDERLCIFVHNLSYEFSFLQGIYAFEASEVFALERRRVAKCTMHDCLEFRCSWIHSNMSLDKYLQSMRVPHKKLTYDYNKVRYWYTELSDDELQYCYNDVLGLVEAIKYQMQQDEDNIYTFCLTSTGYVRRDVKEAMRQVSHNFLMDNQVDYDVYQLLREEFRGGNTHANRYYSNKILKSTEGLPILSADRSSSYPDVIVNGLFPVGKWTKAADDFEAVIDLIQVRHRAVIMRAQLTDVRLKEPYFGAPYMARSKCRDIIGGIYDNGRILSADYLETTINDIDLQIIADEYDCNISVTNVYSSRYGRLPQPLIDLVIEYYRRKTELKGLTEEQAQAKGYTLEDAEYFYMKSKNLLNSIYGLMAMVPVRVPLNYDAELCGTECPFVYDENIDEEALLMKHNKTAYTAYSWGCWVTSLSRLRLEEGIKLCGHRFIYCDTDSCKYMGVVDWDAYNKQRIKDSKKNGAYAVDAQGVVHYMGVFEPEFTEQAPMIEFKTMGAKKYGYRTIDGKLHITIAGVNKKLGAEELEEAGGLEAMKEDFVFHKAGGTLSIYNDRPAIDWYVTEDNYKIPITANVVIADTTKTLGLTDEYRELLEVSKTIEL